METLQRPLIMGILNVTPDSFSDGGDFFDHGEAIKHAVRMLEEGADIIDIGGESSRPGSEPISAEEELHRVIPVIKGLCHSKGSYRGSRVLLSIDTTKADVASKAIKAGAGMINDISAGTFDPEMFKVAASFGVPICIMHMRGRPKTMQSGDISYDDVIGEVLAFLKERAAVAVSAGVKRENIIIDPGIGFGKTVENNITILKELKRLKELRLKILIGTSRKSFIGKILGSDNPKERLEGSLATAGIAVQNGANILRVHDVAETKRFLEVMRRCL